jgi:BirA family biotin operon repressor/biotin-[acetyl-CoA-carboxylase] ligase
MAGEFSLEALRSQLRTSFMGRRAIYRRSVTSTMDAARGEAEAGVPEGAVVIADEQTAGRGRLGRQWVSPPGTNIYVSVILHPPAAHLRQLSIIFPLAICEGIEEVTGLAARIEWPNDVLVGGRKVSGVLLDAEIVGDQVRYAIAGIGLNVNFDPSTYEELRDIATSLRRELGREVSREAVLAALLNHLEPLYQGALLGEKAHLAWKERLDTLGKSVRVGFADRMEEGVAVDTDSDGALILRRDDGTTARIEAGEVTLRPDQAP